MARALAAAAAGAAGTAAKAASLHPVFYSLRSVWTVPHRKPTSFARTFFDSSPSLVALEGFEEIAVVLVKRRKAALATRK